MGYSRYVFVGGKYVSTTEGCKLRLFIDGLSTVTGGGRNYLVNLLKSHIPDGIEVYLLASEELAKESFDSRVHLLSPDVRLPNAYARYLWQFFRLPSLIKSLSIDTLYFPGCIVPSSTVHLGRVVCCFQNMLPFDLRQRSRFPLGLTRLRYRLLKRSFSRSFLDSDAIIFLSDYAKSAVLNEIPAISGKEISVIPHGTTELFRNESSSSKSWPAKLPAREYLFYPSPLTYYKNQLELVQAFARFKRESASELMLVLAGGGMSSYVRAVKELVRKLDVGEDVQILGHVAHNEIAKLYANSLAIVFPSSCENCPVTLLEAMSSGKPILCSSLSPMPEFGKNAVRYIEPESSESIYKGIKEIVSDGELRAKLALEAKTEGKKWTFEKTAVLTWDVLFPERQEGSVLQAAHL